LKNQESSYQLEKDNLLSSLAKCKEDLQGQMTSVAQQGDNLQSLITSLKSQIQDLKVEKDALDEANLKLCQEIEASVAKSQAMEKTCGL